MRAIRKTYVDIKIGQMHGRLMEGDDPPIVFLHQTASSSASYVPTLSAMTLSHHLVAIDTPGFGGSFDPEGWPSMEDYADWMLQTFRALGLERVHLVGHHTGASLAIEIAAKAPDAIRSMTLIGPVFMTAQEREAFSHTYSKPIPLARDGSHLLVNWNYAATHNQDCQLEIIQTEVLSMLRARQGRAQAYSAVAKHDAAARSALVGAPVLLVTSPGDFFHQTFDRARQAFPKAVLGTVGGDNFQASVDPAGVAATLEGFIRGLAPPSHPAD